MKCQCTDVSHRPLREGWPEYARNGHPLYVAVDQLFQEGPFPGGVCQDCADVCINGREVRTHDGRRRVIYRERQS